MKSKCYPDKTQVNLEEEKKLQLMRELRFVRVECNKLQYGHRFIGITPMNSILHVYIDIYYFSIATKGDFNLGMHSQRIMDKQL